MFICRKYTSKNSGVMKITSVPYSQIIYGKMMLSAFY